MLKKRVLSLILVIILAAGMLLPTSTQAAITPYFVLINEMKLPFSEDTMPFFAGSDILVPVTVFRDLEVWAVGSDDLDFVRLYRGNRYIDFHTRPGETRTINQDGVNLRWPPARRIGGRFYVPLRQVCDFFGLTFQTVPVPRDIIPEMQMHALRIISYSTINGPTAVGMNREAIRASYLEFFVQQQPPPGGEEIVPPPPEEDNLPPDYSDVTIHLSFYNISAGGASWILDLLDIQAALGFRACFFVSADDIFDNPGLIRRISGTGHTLGIWLNDGTFEEYLETSALLFEAAKVRTVIVSAGYAAETAIKTAAGHGLIFWDSSASLVDYSAQSIAAITAMIPREGGSRKNLLFSCSEQAASTLPGVYSFLRANEFTVERITETVLPIPNKLSDY